MNSGQRIFWDNSCHFHLDIRYNNDVLAELNDCIGGLLYLGLNVITFRT